MTRAQTLTGIAVAAIVAAAGCGSAAATDGSGTSTESSSASGPTAPTPTVLSGKQKDVTFHGNRMRIEVYQIERSGKLATLEFGARNLSDAGKDDPEEQAGPRDSLGRGGTYDVSAVALVDRKGEKKHLPARYDGECMCTRQLEGLFVPYDKVLRLNATYVLPADVKTVDVSLDKYGTIADVPVR